jgi:hypothetical protein
VRAAGGSLRGLPLSHILAALAAETGRERIAVADLVIAMQDRALAALMFVFAFPNALPMPPGMSAVLGVPLLFLTAQLALGRGPWLPRAIARRSMAQRDFALLVRRVMPWLVRAERLLKPRLVPIARPPMEYAIGCACFVLAVVLLLPIPFGNIPPAIAICMFALGVLERDGAWVIAGCAVAVAAVSLAWGVFGALLKSAVYLLGNGAG